MAKVILLYHLNKDIYPFAFDMSNQIWILGFIIVVVTIASIGPAWGAARVKAVQTVFYEKNACWNARLA
ncbi:MAG: hypothetical protein E6I32_20355 [Chloroflexi bacterium]|nr:MAG: hypothetical protein E6I32_20355 [Chloroflexota bacterium]